jgi:putative membrane protein
MLALAAVPLGPLARHMAAHILTMSIVAPLLALAMIAAPARTRSFAWGRGTNLAAATATQVLLLWAWHAPPAMEALGHTLHGRLLMHASLAAAALWFWLEVFSDRSTLRWRALAALALTGKLFCLLGVLLVFAPRALYAVAAIAPAPDGLADQQLAGLLMVIACPLTYVLAAVVIAARGLQDIAARSGASTAPAR